MIEMAGETARLRERLFDDFSSRLARFTGEAVGPFVCPICLERFTRDVLAATPPELTLAHVIPESLGGRFCTLACALCNNEIGSDLEAFLLERYRAEDAFNGVGTIAGRMEFEFGSVGVELQAAPPGEPWTVLVIEKQTNPTVLERLNDSIDAPADGGLAQVASKIIPRFRNQPSRVSAALYQSAYLLMFAYFGYDFVFDDRYRKLREQILKPDEEILPATFDVPPEAWADAMISCSQPHAVMFVKEPTSFIMPIFRLRPKSGRERVVGVPLPGLDDTAWPNSGPRGKVKGVLVRFRIERDDGARPSFRELWEQAKRMP